MSDGDTGRLRELRELRTLHARHGSTIAIIARDAELAEQLIREHARNALRAQILAHHLGD